MRNENDAKKKRSEKKKKNDSPRKVENESEIAFEPNEKSDDERNVPKKYKREEVMTKHNESAPKNTNDTIEMTIAIQTTTTTTSIPKNMMMMIMTATANTRNDTKEIEMTKEIESVLENMIRRLMIGTETIENALETMIETAAEAAAARIRKTIISQRGTRSRTSICKY